MFERRPLLGLLIGLTLCVSIWRMSMQEPSMIETEFTNNYASQLQSQGGYQTHQDHSSQPISSSYMSPLVPYAGNGYDYSGGYGGGNGGAVTRKDTSSGNINKFYNRRNRNSHSISNSYYNKNNSQNYFSRIFNNRNQNNMNISSSSSMSSLIMPPSSSSSLSSPSYMPFLTNVNYESLPKNDFNQLIDLDNFDFLMNQEACSNPQHVDYLKKGSKTDQIDSNRIDDNSNYDVKNKDNSTLLLVLVHSAPGNYDKRMLIRETWGSVLSPNLRLIFLLGTVKTNKEQLQLEQENRLFSDMVQGNFVDAYRNMTYKHIMALKWFTYYCPNTRFILKIDDDVFVNTPYLLNYLNSTAPKENFLFCDLKLWARIKRTYRSKWRVSPHEYHGRFYPPYCSGYAIVYSADTAFRLYQEGQKAGYFWIDDVHVTGTLAQKANITVTPLEEYILFENDCKSILAGKTDINNFRFLFTWPDIRNTQIKSLWKLTESLR